MHDVLEAAGTNGNFYPSKLGLVGGHCIGVGSHYLFKKAQELVTIQIWQVEE
jgi:UDP-N-acetyl-D-mannosaminuronate dehydrogenase